MLRNVSDTQGHSSIRQNHSLIFTEQLKKELRTDFSCVSSFVLQIIVEMCYYHSLDLALDHNLV